MGNKWRKWLVAVAVVASTAMAENANAQGSVSLQVFYDELQPYGTWVDHGRHGYVWMPNAGADFVPYGSNGYWVQTGYGNTWVSNYSWGWAPFHYGRWFYDDFYGWLWLPDTTWGPAWVTWRSGGGYYGWAPLMPGLSVSMNVGYYNDIPNHYWNFVPYRYVMYRQVYRHCVPRPRVVNVIHHTTVIVNNNYYRNEGPSGGRDRSDDRDRGAYFTGPTRSEIEKRNGERIPVYDVHDRNSPGHTEVSRNSVSLYKPAVEQSSRTRALPAQFTRDNEQGRDNISEIRSRQLRERSSGGSDDNRGAIRSNEDAATNRSSMDRMLRDNEGSDRTPRNIDDLRRGTPSPSLPDQRTIDRSADNNRRDALDRLGRDTEFNRMKEQEESDQLRRQQSDVQRRQQLQRDGQLQRFQEQRQEEQHFDEQNRRRQDQLQQLNRSNQRESNDQEVRRRSSGRQEQLQQPRQRQYEAPRQSPTRQPGQSQQRTAPPSRQQQFDRSQQSPSGDRRLSSPGRSGASQQMQRQGATRSSSPQRSRD